MAITRISTHRPAAVHTPKAHAVAPPRAAKIGETFKEGVPYDVTVGHRDIAGVAKLTKRNGVYHMEMPITFVGGLAFGTSNAKLSGSGGLPPLSNGYFKAGAKGIEQLPALKKRVIDLSKQVEELLSTDKFKLKILPHFLADERPVLRKFDLIAPAERKRLQTENGADAAIERETSDLIQALTNGATTQRARFKGNLPIIVTPLPNANLVTPTLWDVGTKPALLAHEVGHLLGIENEGFSLKGYPLDGIMNDEMAFNALERVSPGSKPKLTEADFNEMMQKLAIQVVNGPKPDPKVARKEFSPTPVERYDTPSNSPRMKWGDLPYATRERMTEQAAREFLKNR